MSKQETKRRTRRMHSPEFKADAVRLVREGGRRVAELARDLGLADSVVRTWVRQAEVDAGRGPAGALTTAEKEELSQLRLEVKRIVQPVDFRGRTEISSSSDRRG